MAHINIEFKAKVKDLSIPEKKLLLLDPFFVGEDHQTDTYFNVDSGRLKLREGKIENSLIFYERSDTAGIKQSNVLLYSHQPDKTLKDILIRLHGVKVVVVKKRGIYFIDNVKFHFDYVDGLGSFIEVEAIDKNGDIGVEKLKEQCDFYRDYFEIGEEDFIKGSYSDLLLLLSN
jgi:predicted adenylyl cyclase CyaB